MTKKTVKEQAAPIVSKASLYKKTAQIASAIVAAQTSGNALQVEYHKIACSIILHLGENKDIRVLRSMFETMPESLRKDSMAKFMDLYAPVSFDEVGEVHYNADKPVKLGEALENAWWKAKLPTVYTPFIFEAEVAKLVEKAEKRLEKGVSIEKGDQLTAKQVQALRALIKPATKPEAVKDFPANAPALKQAKVKKAA